MTAKKWILALLFLRMISWNTACGRNQRDGDHCDYDGTCGSAFAGECEQGLYCSDSATCQPLPNQGSGEEGECTSDCEQHPPAPDTEADADETEVDAGDAFDANDDASDADTNDADATDE